MGPTTGRWVMWYERFDLGWGRGGERRQSRGSRRLCRWIMSESGGETLNRLVSRRDNGYGRFEKDGVHRNDSN